MGLQEIATSLGIAFTVGAAVLQFIRYLIRIEKTLSVLATAVKGYCEESRKDRANLWLEHNSLRSSHSDHGERITRVEARIDAHQHHVRTKPA